MDWSSLGLAAAASSTSGLSLYATVLTLGILHRFHWMQLPAEWKALGETWVIGLAAVLFVIEFVADKIPYVDNLWDGMHTFIRIPAGAVFMASAFAGVEPATRLIAGLLGGSLALTTHSAKASARLAANSSPEPFSNSVLSLLENFVTVFLLGLAASHPGWALVILVVVLGICAIVLYTCIRFARTFFRKLRGWLSANPDESSVLP
ncbi:MAG: DUF4126 domain-containing protein [Pyrinomonadaceae bacterium]